MQPETTLPKTPAIKIYTALLTQNSTSNPTATVLNNTLGNIIWTRIDVGRYRGTLTGLFTTTNKQFFQITNNCGNNGNPLIFIFDENQIEIVTYSAASDGTEADGMLFETPFEIRVYTTT